MKRYCFLISMFFICILSFLSVQADFTKNIHGYLWANYLQFNGQTSKSDHWYNTIIRTNGSLYNYKGYINLLYDNGNYNKVVNLMKKIKNSFDDDPDIQLIFIQSLHNLGHKKKAEELLIQLSNKFPLHAEVALETARVYIERKEFKNALNTIDSILNGASAQGNIFGFYFLKAHIYAQLQEYVNAHANINKCIEYNPYFDKGWLLQGIIKEQEGKIQEAMQGYQLYLNVTSTPNKQIEQHLLELSSCHETMYNKALLLFERKQYEESLKYSNLCLKNNQHHIDAQLLKIQNLCALNNHKKAIACLENWLIKNPNDPQLLAMLHLLARHLLTKNDSSIQSIIDALERIYNNNQNTILLSLYLADLYTRLGNPDQALAYHIQSLNQVHNAELEGKIRLQMGFLYYDKQQYSNMLEIIAPIKKGTIAFAPALNLQAYYLIKNEKNYKKAQKLISKALKKAAHNPHFLDTQATLYYKKKKYQQALRIFKKISLQAPEDTNIMIHLGKTYYKTGDTKKALASMHRANTYADTIYEQQQIQQYIKKWSTQPS